MKTSVVTGGASGIGLELSKLLIEDNYKVFIIDNNSKNLHKLKTCLDPNSFEGIKEDMSSVSSPKKIYNKLKDKILKSLLIMLDLEILVNSTNLIGKEMKK